MKYFSDLYKRIVPTLSDSLHKGQSGRIAVIGGTKLYTGAPYFAGMSILRAGGDLAYVVCEKEAGLAIKSYSPELMVAPVIPNSEGYFEQMLLDRLHAVVIGPGLGREKETLEYVEETVIPACQQKNIPIVLDGDGLWLVKENPACIKSYGKAILTPNIMEMRRLWKKLFGQDKETFSSDDLIKASKELENVTILLKSSIDKIANADCEGVLECDTEFKSLKRCGGIGDILAGCVGLFTYWSTRSGGDTKDLMEGCQLASFVVRLASFKAYQIYGRGLVARDIISFIIPAMKEIEESME